MSWDETLPENDDQVKGIGGVLRDRKADFRAALERHFYWTDSSNASAGVPRLYTASADTGSARAFYAAESAVSAHRDGTLFVTSDTTRLVGLTSASSVLLGAGRAVHLSATSASNHYVLVQHGHVITEISTSLLTDKSYSIAFPITYNGVPSVFLSEQSIGFGSVGISAVTQGGFTMVNERNGFGNNGVRWRSVGTTDL